jgi:hypothetical protein
MHEISAIMLKTSFLNTNGARGNLVYIKKLIEKSDIVFCCEHKLNKYEKKIFEILNKNVNLSFFLRCI